MENLIAVNYNHSKSEVILEELFNNDSFREKFIENLKSKRNLLLFSFDEENYKNLKIQ